VHPEAVGHREPLRADQPRGFGGVAVAGDVGHAGEQLVRGCLEVLIGDRVGGELARRVRLGPREQHEPLAPRSHDRVLELGGRGAVGVEPGADDPLLLLGLDQVLGEDAAELGVAGDVRRGTQLGQRLLLDRVGVGQVLDELFASGGHAPPLRAYEGANTATG
jgi:hypothetical protein